MTGETSELLECIMYMISHAERLGPTGPDRGSRIREAAAAVLVQTRGCSPDEAHRLYDEARELYDAPPNEFDLLVADICRFIWQSGRVYGGESPLDLVMDTPEAKDALTAALEREGVKVDDAALEERMRRAVMCSKAVNLAAERIVHPSSWTPIDSEERALLDDALESR